ncbi:hypothetical protein DFS33DRAFT_14811 [Desarmillaria ectypa]|nr:hypothetical protein DFS33DRAFT_14811 [Desarmillaria ectypa]
MNDATRLGRISWETGIWVEYRRGVCWCRACVWSLIWIAIVNFLYATSFSHCHSRSVASQGLIKVLSGKKAYFTLAVLSCIAFPGIANRGSFPDPLTQEMPPEHRNIDYCMAR